MIKCVFSYDKEPIATFNDVSRVSNKKVWQMMEEAITQQIKSRLIVEFADIREQMDEGNLVIECNCNSSTQSFDFSYTAAPALADLIEDRLKKN